MSRLSDLISFYALLDRVERKLGGKRTLSALGRSDEMPVRGVYFFFERAESRKESGDGPRVVRVGTHALTDGSKSTLRQRLQQHRGNHSGRGNHRGSIFRGLLGNALQARGTVTPCRSWGLKSDIGKAAAALGVDRCGLAEEEAPIEEAVSRYIDQMPLLWIGVDDDPGPNSLRGLIERNSIALLSNFQRSSLDAPSSRWLGHDSNRPGVRLSGLWNQRHVDETHDPGFIKTLDKLIRRA